MNLGWNLRELVRKRDLDVQRRWRDGQLEWNTMLNVLWCLPVEDNFRVHLAQLVDLDVGHGHVVILHLRLLSMLLPRQHVIVHLLVKHAFFQKKSN